MEMNEKLKRCPFTLSVDMDGTLARFYDDENWRKRMNEPGHYLNLPAYYNLTETIRRILTETEIPVTFISAYPFGNPGAGEEKN